MSEKHASLPEALLRARDVARRLTEETERLNHMLVATENALIELKLGVRAGVTLEPLTDEYESTVLTFGKYAGKWQLFITEERFDRPDEGEVTPLLNANREERLVAADHMPALVMALVTEAERQVEMVATKTNELREFVLSFPSDNAPDVSRAPASTAARVAYGIEHIVPLAPKTKDSK